jgi:hypothetical protein
VSRDPKKKASKKAPSKALTKEVFVKRVGQPLRVEDVPVEDVRDVVARSERGIYFTPIPNLGQFGGVASDSAEMHDWLLQLVEAAQQSSRVEALAEGFAAGREVGRAEFHAPSSEAGPHWSKLATVAVWARAFGVHRNTMGKRLRSQTVRNKQVGGLFQVAVEDLPEKEKEKHLP